MYCNGRADKEAFDAKLEFDIKVIPYEGDDSWVEEAVLKALGTGWSAGLGFSQIEVVKRQHGAPGVRLHGKAAVHAEELGVTHIHLSITHDGAYAAAVAIAEIPWGLSTAK